MYVNVPAVDVGTFIETEFPLVVVIVWVGPPLIVYANVYGAVPLAPVKIIVGDAPFKQTSAVLRAMVAVGRGFTVTTADPVCD